MENFKWIGRTVECPYQTLKTGKYDFFGSFKWLAEEYRLGEFVKINRSARDEICRLICVYQSYEGKDQQAPLKGFVQPYLFAYKLHDKLNCLGIRYDDQNELIQDHDSLDVIVNLLDIKGKCNVIFASEKDPTYLITKKKLDKSCNFFCKYKYDGNEIIPIFPDTTSCTSSEESLSESDNEKEHNGSKKIPNKTSFGKENHSNDKSGIESTPVKGRKRNSNYLFYKKESDVKTDLLNSLTNLNLDNSFENPDNCSIITNYSIVSDVSDKEDELKIKLKKKPKMDTKAVKSPIILLEKLNLNNVSPENSPTNRLKNKQLSDVKNHIDQRQTSVRRSHRLTGRVSYAEFISPIDKIPTKRSKRVLNDELEKQVGKENIYSNNIDSKKVKDEVQKVPKTSRSQRKASKYFYYESDSIESCDSEDSLSPVNKRRLIKEKKIYSPDSPHKIKHKETSLKTPKTPKTRGKLLENTPKSNHKGTPSRIRLLRNGEITPSMQSRDKARASNTTPLMKARSQLHVSYVPKALPCREKEYLDIHNFLEAKLSDGCGGCMYVSGVPGTGKTATVTSVINNLLQGIKSDNIPNFEFVSINGMRLTEPRQAYVEILKQVTNANKTIPWEQAQNMLEEIFTKTKKNKTPVVLLVDELDILCTKRQDVVYNILDWPTKAKRQLIVITIANTMDLPERLLMSRVTSRLGLTRLTFQAYTHKQLQEIVTKRLTGTNSFNPDAIQLVARKVASVSGDARRALDICRRAAEIAELEGPDAYVTMEHVNNALSAMITQPKVQAIKRCSLLEQFILQSVVAENERTGVEETVFYNVLKMLTSISTINGFPTVNSGLALAAVSRLSACRLLITDQKCSDINQRIILNVSNDDVYYALRKD